MMLIRPSAVADIPAVTRIYSHWVRLSAATFEIDPPDGEEIALRRTKIVEAGLPYVVAEIDGEVGGYAYATPYRPRYAYRFTVEDSIYVDPAQTGKGLGRMLLEEIIRDCERQGYQQMIAVVGDSANQASIRLHRALGFQPVGILRHVGFKFERWVDTVLLQRELPRQPEL